MTKQLVPNIVRGGIAIPIPGRPNYYYMKGRKHKNGGIDIGANPKTGIEVEDGEVLHIAPGEMRVFSAQPFLYGGSPANRVLAGDNPNQVFAAQEEYKDRHNLNDDGTKKKKCGGKKKTNNRIYSVTTNKGTKLRYLENDKPFDYEKFDNGGYKLTAENSPIEYLYTNPDGKKIYIDNYGAQYIQNGDKVELYNGGHGNPSDFNVPFPTMEEIREYYEPNTDIYFNNTDAIAEANPDYYWDKEFNQETPTFSEVLTPVFEVVKYLDGTYDSYGNYKPYWERPTESGYGALFGQVGKQMVKQAVKQAAKNTTKQAMKAQARSIARANARWARKVATRELPQINVSPATNYEEAARIAGRFYGKLPSKVRSGVTKITKPFAKPVSKALKPLGEGIGKFFEKSGNIGSRIGRYIEPRMKAGVDKSEQWLTKRFKAVEESVKKGKEIAGKGKEAFSNKSKEVISNTKEAINKGRNFANSRYEKYGPIVGKKEMQKELLMASAVPAGTTLYAVDNAVGNVDNDDNENNVGLNINYDEVITPSDKMIKGLNLDYTTPLFYNVNNTSFDPTYIREYNKKTLLHTDYIPQTDSKGNTYYVRNPLKIYKNGGKINTTRRKYRIGGDGVVVPTSPMWIEKTVPYYKYDNVGLVPFIIDGTSMLPYVPGGIGYTQYPVKYEFKNPEETTTTEDTSDSDISEEQIVAPPTNSPNKSYNMSSTSTNKTVASATPAETTTTPASASTTTTTSNTTTPATSTAKTTNTTGEFPLTLRDVLGRNFVGIGDIYDLIDKFHKSKKPELDIPPITEELLLRNANKNPRIRRAKLKRAVNSAPFRDLASLTSNLIGSLTGYYANKAMLKDMKYPGQPILEQAAKLKTDYNINPRLANVRENLASTIDDITANTGSSNVAIDRINRARLAAMLQSDQLYGEKENQETQLINQDKLNRQEVANRNVATYNDWRNRKTEFENLVREQQAGNIVGLANNINSAVQGVIGNINQRVRDNNTIKAYLIANPNVPAELYYNEGLITLRQLKDIYARREAEKQYQLELAKLTNVTPNTTTSTSE